MMSSWLPFLADVLIASTQNESPTADFTGKHGQHHQHHHHQHERAHRYPLCYSPEGYGPISKIRQFDLTPCFESAAVLPAPLVVLLVAGIIDVARVGRKGPKRRRAGWSKARLWMKMIFLIIAFVTAVVHLVLVLVHTPHAFKNIITLPSVLHLLAIPVLAALSWFNHLYSLRSSSVILLFWPVYLIALATVFRTRFSMLQQDHSTPLYGAGYIYGSWNKTGKASFALFACSVGFGIMAWIVDIFGPEQGGIRIGEEIDYANGNGKTQNGKANKLKTKPRSRSRSGGYQGVASDDEDVIAEVSGEDDSGEDRPAKKTIEEKIAMEHAESPVLKANIYSRLTFGFLTPLMRLGARRYIEEDDMWPLPPSDSAEALNARLSAAWQQQRSHVANGQKKRASLKIAIFKAFGGPFIIAGCLKAAYDVLSFLQPQLLRLLLSFVQSYATTDKKEHSQPQPAIQGFVVAFGMFACANLATFLLHQYFERAFESTMRVRSALAMLIYQKSLILSNGEKGGRTTGDIVNLQSVDTVRIADLLTYLHIAWSGPFQIIIAFVSLYNLLGWQAFVGVAIMVVSLPVNAVIARRQKRLQKEQMKNKDKRTRLMNEVLSNIKSIKLYGWEKAFSEKVLNVRNNQELTMLKKIGYNNSMSFFFWSSTPFLVALGTFSTYALTSPHPLTSDKIFPAISLFQLLAFPLGVFSNIISSIIEAAVSVTRLESYLEAKELQKDARVIIRPDASNGYDTPRRGQEVVKIENGEFQWSDEDSQPTLQQIDLTVNKGELVAVLGRVGDGKTSLLSCILGEMRRTDGSVTVRGDIAYFNQNAFILSASIKDNIIFGTKFDKAFYEKVLDACALRPDLAIMAEGDATQVGEKGVSLSGGQKARISLARCVYARADLYLLDDPLSAVDAHVGKHVWDNVFGAQGLLSSKARILCTNAITWLPSVDKIVMLRRGVILETSSYTQAMANPDSEIYKLITTMGNQPEEEHKEDEAAESPSLIEDVPDEADDAASEHEQDAARIPKMDRRMSIATMRRASVLSTRAAKIEAVRDLKEDSRPKETREKGAVNRQVYRDYISAASRFGVASFGLCILGAQATSIAGNLILRYWAQANNAEGTNQSTGTYLLWYGCIGVLSSALSVAATLLLQVLCAIRCSKQMHDKSFAALMRSPMSFFEQTPQGRVLNIFTRDMHTIDEVLVRVFSGFFRTMTSVLGVIGVIAFGAPWVLVAVLPLAFVYRSIMKYYLATSRELKRLDAVSRAPIFSWLNESLSGAPIVRAFNQVQRFSSANEARLDRNQHCFMPAMNVNRWLAVRLESLGSFLILAAALASVLSVVVGKGKVDSGLTGIILVYVSNVSGAFGWAVRSASDVESNITSVERVLGYTHLTPEAPYEIEENKPAPSWPQEGTITFKNYTARYRPELNPSLRDVNLHIKGGDTIGICGRTGAGKSTITLALFRIIEPSGGQIFIDGVDITTIGLKDLRHAISIIPQDPQLFEGTVRGNVDPIGDHSDADIWHALEQSYLKDFVQNQLGGLDAQVSEGGSNFSSGQRQLVCFARALLRNTRILVLDEATSSIDLETDEAVQQILRGKAFDHVTKLIIAHRLGSIAHSDKILVLEQGTVAEYDSPAALLAKPESLYASLVGQANKGGRD